MVLVDLVVVLVDIQEMVVTEEVTDLAAVAVEAATIQAQEMLIDVQEEVV
tara:strand:- start:227 stop:376 length:150 start_codon:yes stop_codon:yes gene_type:complete